MLARMLLDVVTATLKINLSMHRRAGFKDLVGAVPDLAIFILENIFNFYLKLCSGLRSCRECSQIAGLSAARRIKGGAIEFDQPGGEIAFPFEFLQVGHTRVKLIEKGVVVIESLGH